MPVGKRGGAAPGERRGGSKKGSAVYKQVRVRSQAALDGIRHANAEDRTPLQFLLAVMSGREPEVEKQRFDAAVAAAPYVHPRLAAVAIKEIPDGNAERRKSMLAGLNYQQRQAIAGILAAAALGDDEVDTPAVVEGTEESK